VLEVRQEVSAEEIKAAYRRQLAQYHADKFSSPGRELRELVEASTASGFVFSGARSSMVCT
jgi:DnaJ-class molecular chaperone